MNKFIIHIIDHFIEQKITKNYKGEII